LTSFGIASEIWASPGERMVMFAAVRCHVKRYDTDETVRGPVESEPLLDVRELQAYT
jgi:hypothetical protein